MKTFFASVVLGCILLSGCGDPPPDQGYVIDKSFVPAHWEDGFETYYVPEMQCRSVSEYDYASKTYETRQVCDTQPVAHQRYEPHYQYVQDAWRLRLEDCKIEHEKKKCHRGWKRVDETTFHAYEIGQHYPDPK